MPGISLPRIHLGMALVTAPLALATLWSLPASLAEQGERPGPSAGAGFRGLVVKALRTQTDLLDHQEHCSVDPDRLRAIGRAEGQQVRVATDSGGVAVYTVSETRDETPESLVRMGLSARKRLGGTDEFKANFLAQVPDPTLDDLEAHRRGELVERSDDDGHDAGLLVLAPHGGDIERFTDAQAERVAVTLKGKPVTTWRCLGYAPKGVAGPSAFARWHITSTDIHEASFPRLARIASRDYAYALSFHGMDREAILIGGAGPMVLKREIKAALVRVLEGSGIPVEIAAIGDSLGGSHPHNIVNRYCPGTGIQIEQSSRARRDYWQAIADAVAGVYVSRL